MSALLPIVVLGILILILCFRLLRQSASAAKQPVTAEEFENAREALDAIFVETAAIQRVFSAEDAEFISHSGSLELQHLFLKERKALAMHWLRKTQKQVAHLMGLYLRLASYTIESNPASELKLAVKYALFLLLSNVVLFLLWLRGPFRTGRIIGYMVHFAGAFCTIFSLRLANVTAVQLRDSSESTMWK
jgi:uncharacterized membrane protein YqjE